MPTSMTFTSLQGDVQAYLERGGSYDAAAIQQLPRLINNADRKSTRLNSSHGYSSYAVSCLKKTMVATYRTYNLAHHDEMVRPYDGVVEAVYALAQRALPHVALTSDPVM